MSTTAGSAARRRERRVTARPTSRYGELLRLWLPWRPPARLWDTIGLAAVALAIPAGNAGADKPATFACPDGFMGPFPVGFVTNKDKNDNGFVCVKENDMQLVFKHDTCNPNCDKDDLTAAALAGLLNGSYTDDNILP